MASRRDETKRHGWTPAAAVANGLWLVHAPRLTDADPLPPDDRVVGATINAFVQLYRNQARRLLRFFARRAGQQDACDLVQESFVRLADNAAAAADTIEKPEAYLNRVATNVLRNRARTALRRSLAHHVPAETVDLCGADPISALEARDQLNRIQATLLRLSPKTRDIFLAHRVEGLSYADIATRSGLRVKGVEWHMTKAIAAIDRARKQR